MPASSTSWSAGANNDEQWIQVSDVINMLTKSPKHSPPPPPYVVTFGAALEIRIKYLRANVAPNSEKFGGGGHTQKLGAKLVILILGNFLQFFDAFA